MATLNKVFLIGHLGRDPEIKTVNGGLKIANLALATDEYGKDKTTTTEWHNLTCFEKLADIAEQYLRKGSKIHIEGRLKTDRWEKDGVKCSMTKIIVTNLQMLDSKASATGNETTQPKPVAAGYDNNKPASAAATRPTQPAAPVYADDVPF